MPVDQWELGRLVNAYETVRAAELSYEEAKKQLGEINATDSWLRAESYHKRAVKEWLLAEERHGKAQLLLAHHEGFKAAERGWRAMRAITQNLDGVEEFSQLSPILRDRYAVFACAVLGLDVDFEPNLPCGLHDDRA